MLRYYKQKHHFIIFFVNIHICLLSVSKSLQQRYIFSCLWHCQQLPVCFKMSQSVPICLKMSQNVSKSTQFFSKLILRHFETFWVDFEQFWAILSGFLGQVWDILRHFELILSNFEQFWAILSDFERNLFGQQFVYLNSPFSLHVIPAQLEFTNYGDWS